VKESRAYVNRDGHFVPVRYVGREDEEAMVVGSVLPTKQPLPAKHPPDIFPGSVWSTDFSVTYPTVLNGGSVLEVGFFLDLTCADDGIATQAFAPPASPWTIDVDVGSSVQRLGEIFTDYFALDVNQDGFARQLRVYWKAAFKALSAVPALQIKCVFAYAFSSAPWPSFLSNQTGFLAASCRLVERDLVPIAGGDVFDDASLSDSFELVSMSTGEGPV